MSVFAPSMIILWKTIESCGVDPEPLFAAEDIRPKLPIDPSMRMPYEKIDRIRAKAVKLCGDEAIGIRSASVYSASQLGALGYAWQVSMSLRNAFTRLERFIRVVNDKAVVLVENLDDIMVVTIRLDVPSENLSARDDSALAIITRMCTLVYGDSFRLQGVNFKHPAPRDFKPYFEFFACQLNFDQADNQLLIPLSIADDLLVGANPELALLNDQVVTRRLALLDRNDIVARVQSALMEQLPNGQVSDDSVAFALHMSVRTMHRKLADANQNFRTLLVEMRRNLAEMYILDKSLTLTEISLLLGFSEPSSFSRAFKSWTGSAPSEIRQARSDDA
ncbi:MAG: AraC family transcriptional regulator [Xanthomonadales bacterium]|nr:AraC family transcriptional regulator [Xanthomonadales bacterium]